MKGYLIGVLGVGQIIGRRVLSGLKKLRGLKPGIENPEYLWHSPSADFDNFDFSKIGSNSLKYGWGIYFSGALEHSLRHNRSLGHVYKLPMKEIQSLTFLNYSKSLREHHSEVVRAEALKFYGATVFNNELFSKGGHTFYKDILESERLKVKDPNGCAARFLVSAGITGGFLDEFGERILVIYDTELWKKVERVNLVKGKDGKLMVESQS